MILVEEKAERYELCGTPLRLGAGAPGGLRCLLAGGRAETGARQFQHYHACLTSDGVSLAELGRGAIKVWQPDARA